MNTITMVSLLALGAINILLAITTMICAFSVRKRPLQDRSLVQGTVTEVFRKGAGLRVAYKFEKQQYSALQINKGVNTIPLPVSVGSPITVHVNPYRHSNVTLTPRPVRDEMKFMRLFWTQMILTPLTFFVAVLILL